MRSAAHSRGLLAAALGLSLIPFLATVGSADNPGHSIADRFASDADQAKQRRERAQKAKREDERARRDAAQRKADESDMLGRARAEADARRAEQERARAEAEVREVASPAPVAGGESRAAGPSSPTTQDTVRDSETTEARRRAAEARAEEARAAEVRAAEVRAQEARAAEARAAEIRAAEARAAEARAAEARAADVRAAEERAAAARAEEARAEEQRIAEARRAAEEVERLAAARRQEEIARAVEERRAAMAAEREVEARRIADALRQAEAQRIARERAREQAREADSLPGVDRRDPPRVAGGPADPEPSEAGPAEAGHADLAPSYPRSAVPASAGGRVAVLLVMEPGNRGIRRHDKTADPVLCGSQGCYVSNGADAPASLLRRNKALGFFRTLGERAGACSRSLGCVFRDVDLADVAGRLQPVDMRLVRHDRREAAEVAGPSECWLEAQRLQCRGGHHSGDYAMWLVPEAIAVAAGPILLERALSEGLADPRQASIPGGLAR